MTSRLVRTEFDRRLLLRFIEQQKPPFTVNIVKGAKRSIEQNRLQQKWMAEAAQQLEGYTAEEHRGFCKLHFGVPILREEDQVFREKYDRIIKPMSYEHKLECMMVPFDFPVTRLMTAKQKSRYLDIIVRHFMEKGVALSMPEERAA